jgi:membrane protease YdiL (CAAX protease family)
MRDLGGNVKPAIGADRPLSRPVSGLEFAVGAALVLGHNVWRVLPNEVPILFVLALVSARLREGGWSALGFRRPGSWRRIVIIAVAAAALRLAIGEAIPALTSPFWPPEVAPAGQHLVTHSPRGALAALLLVWTFAAFGEEIGYRGYLTKRGADVGGGSGIAWWIATLIVSALFGFGHFYKGPAGVLDSGVAGLILGAAYLLSGRNLWACILAHGLIDTVAVGAAFLGWDN